MDTPIPQREQAVLGLEQLAALVRQQAWSSDGGPSLPPTQAAVLRMLTGAPQGMRAAQIAERLGISAASLSDSLKTLEGRGWIRRDADPLDRRASLVRLQRAGRTVAAQLSRPNEGLGALVQTLDDTDAGALLRVTQLLVGQAQRRGLATGLRTCMGCRFFRPFASGVSAQPHICGFTGAPFGDAELRVDCMDNQAADAAQQDSNEHQFRLRVAIDPAT